MYISLKWWRRCRWSCTSGTAEWVQSETTQTERDRERERETERERERQRERHRERERERETERERHRERHRERETHRERFILQYLLDEKQDCILIAARQACHKKREESTNQWCTHIQNFKLFIEFYNSQNWFVLFYLIAYTCIFF